MARPWPTIILLACLAVSGCSGLNWSFLEPKKPDIESGKVAGTAAETPISLAYRDTIAQHAWVEGMRMMRVRGYGVVAGLGDRGSSECPARLRDTLISEMYRLPEFKSIGPGERSPEQIIDSVDTAVVSVQGEIPAAATEGSYFDLYVQAIPGTQTTSLEGGRLWACRLHVYRDVSETSSILGKPLAMGQGPVFRNPFSDGEDVATKTDPRRGVVIGGGRTLEDRRVRLVLSSPSYRQAMAIAQRINTRFSGKDTAEAQSPAYVTLRVPDEYHNDPGRFLAIVRHLYVPTRAGFADQRGRELAKEILDPSAPHEEIALAWEGIGRSVLPTLRELYADPRKHVSFYSALAGIRLGDDMAVDTLARHATEESGAYRLPAIQALGDSGGSIHLFGVLRGLLGDPDPRIRVAAYEALHARKDESVYSWHVDRDNFVLDRVPIGEENLVYARRTGDRRIAILGADVRCEPPLFYRDPGGAFTLNALEEDRNVTVIRRTRRPGVVSPPIAADYDVDQLIALLGGTPGVDGDGDIVGLGVDYSAVVQALYELCRLRAINARFMLEQPSTIEMFGPMTRPGRAESAE